MAYKNKAKQKKHVSQLSNTGWRKDKKRISELAKVYEIFTEYSRDAYVMAKKKLGL